MIPQGLGFGRERHDYPAVWEQLRELLDVAWCNESAFGQGRDFSQSIVVCLGGAEFVVERDDLEVGGWVCGQGALVG